ncbi:hypothetical protein CWI75_08310 [Kineobactrum sediminis]|uniref:Uncharacterized protein n=1 Tax=Kineobactrum sediminis TaxID=1905677 RepID=A0A2N5Y2J1_9GAMM|nr:alkaline phosphatase family protein [Kineobactrum sediminis]PLW82579.1 hypothetical protein CWI75_08310 [Kineobactrum sediminis]
MSRLKTLLKRIQLGRSEWLATLLQLPRTEASPSTRGLVMIQIDGLSHAQIQHALERGRMPFLQKLLRRKGYRLHRQYAGMPSSTAAFQGELFYGVKGVVPAFSFRDSDSGEMVRMFEPGAASDVERQLEERGGEPLLQGGSAYVDNYTGGAAEAHYCASALGWGPGLRRANTLVVILLFLSNIYSFIRIAVLFVVELVLAIVDFCRGLLQGRNLVSELKFVPTRVGISIVLRELVTIGVKVDIARGLPIIHLNFLGYDEQAHRRGPKSLFAHWTLKGIDDAVGRLWRAAHRSHYRDYDVWIYSDHGQEDVISYLRLTGRTIEEAVSSVFSDYCNRPVPLSLFAGHGVQTHRVRRLGGKRIQWLFPVKDQPSGDVTDANVAVRGLGPVGFVYCDALGEAKERDAAALELATKTQVPLVMVPNGPGRAIAWAGAAVYQLPEQSADVFGAEHPFLHEVTDDLITLCHHPSAGQFILCGWRMGVDPCSFSNENGAHGGAAPEETSAFVLVPSTVDLYAGGSGPLRATDLRNAALIHLGRSAGQKEE